MKKFIEKNINIIISLFIILGPIIDLFTGISTNKTNLYLSLGIIIRTIFLLFIVIVSIFIFKKKKLIIPYLIIGLYFVFFLIGNIIYKDNVLLNEIHGFIKTFYFPILLITIYSINDHVRISKMLLFTTLFIYLLLIFIPAMFGIGFQTYDIAKVGSLGFYDSANEISGIISLLTPIIFIILYNTKNNIFKILFLLLYLVVILMIGTKTPLISLGITIILSFIYLLIYSIKNKTYKNILICFLIIIIGIVGMKFIIPKTNFYKNIETHLDYLKVDKVSDVFKDKELIDNFIFSQRLTFLNDKANIYSNANNYQRLFGLGYTKNNKTMKLIEMDLYDVYYNHGIIGFIVFVTIVLYVIINIIRKRNKINYERYMLSLSALLILVLSYVTGHIITAPAVDILAVIILLSLMKRSKKDLLFADKDLRIGGIESAQVNLINRIDFNKYNVTLILEEKHGELLKQLDSRVIVKELKVSNNKNTIIRKTINVTRKIIFSIFNYNNYDFSCCYTTYSYSSNVIAKTASKNNSIYVHSDYKYVYPDDKEFREFFDSRKVYEYKNIIFVSNEARESFLDVYKELKNKTIVFNNFVDIEKIKELSTEKIEIEKKEDRPLFVFVGRLDDSSKKLKRAIKLVKDLDIELWIVGDGPDRKMYEDYTNELKVNKHVKFIGRKNNPYPYMLQADYLIITSDYEGFPVTYLEGITLNKPIVTTINTSDDEINMKEYAYIVSKDKITDDVKKILEKKDKKNDNINLEKIFEKRMKKLEKLFDSII